MPPRKKIALPPKPEPPPKIKPTGSAKARRSAARLAAVQALYQIDLAGASSDAVIMEFVRHRIGQEQDGDEFVTAEPVLFGDIVRGVQARLGEVDELLGGLLDRQWSLERMELLLRAILRAGAWELLANAAVAPHIIINDYIDVTHAFFSGREPGMVNGVLDKLARALRSEEMAAKAAAKKDAP
jgi:N utilization substance protein B